jgi:D-galacturonate reductase
VSDQADKMKVLVVGGGMITHDQILPSLFQLQRDRVIGSIEVCALNAAPLKLLAESPRFAEAFPGQGFAAHPSLDTPPDKMHPNLYRDLVQALPPSSMVVVAVPDHVHAQVIQTVLDMDQHVLCVKPLVPTHAEAVAIERLAAERGLFVGIEYHKRFDRRALDARALYRAGRFGRLRCAEAKMIEPYAYRHSNFQNWFSKENSDPFTYVGCHYIDLVHFITGLKPVEVSVRGVEGTFPNGKLGYMWAQGQVVWGNGALLSVTDGLGYPDEGAGCNDQGLVMYCEGQDCASLIKHDDQFRGVSHCYTDHQAGAAFRFVSPDYFRLVPWDGPGLRPVGYGFESIQALIRAAQEVIAAGRGLQGEQALDARQCVLKQINDRGIIATPGNSWINELVTEAARLSIVREGHPVKIEYEPTPCVRLRP